jgi:hypothetical protein
MQILFVLYVNTNKQTMDINSYQLGIYNSFSKRHSFPPNRNGGIYFREKYKISPCGLLDLQFTPCCIKTNLKVPVVCKKNNLVPTVKFHPLT